MKKSKKLGLLVGALVVVSVAAFGVSRIQAKKEKIKSGESVILTIPKDTVTALSWKTDTANLAFTKNDDGTWSYNDDSAFPVSTTAIENLLDSFENLESSYTIEEADDIDQYGLDEPVCSITLTADDKDYDIELGDFSKMDSQRYATIGDENVYLLKEDLYETYDVDLTGVIENDTMPAFDSVSSVTFKGLADYTFTKDEDDSLSYCETDTYYTDGNPLDTDKVDAYFNTLRYLSLTDYATYNATDEELESYGLDNPTLSMEIAYTDEDENGKAEDGTFTMELGVNKEELAKAVETGTWNEDGTPIPDAAADSSEDTNTSSDTDSDTDSDSDTPTCYARVNGSQIVYVIPESTYESLIAAKYDDLRHNQLLTASFDDITSIDITLEGENYTFTSKGTGDDKKWYYNDEEIDLADLETAFSAATASSFTTGNPSDKEEISFTIHLDNKNFPEIKIGLYRYDGSYCISEIDGEPTGMINRNLVVDIIEAVNAIVLQENE